MGSRGLGPLCAALGSGHFQAGGPDEVSTLPPPAAPWQPTAAAGAPQAEPWGLMTHRSRSALTEPTCSYRSPRKSPRGQVGPDPAPCRALGNPYPRGNGLREERGTPARGSPGQRPALSPGPCRDLCRTGIPPQTPAHFLQQGRPLLTCPPSQGRAFYLKARRGAAKAVASLGASEPRLPSPRHPKPPQRVSACHTASDGT